MKKLDMAWAMGLVVGVVGVVAMEEEVVVG